MVKFTCIAIPHHLLRKDFLVRELQEQQVFNALFVNDVAYWTFRINIITRDSAETATQLQGHLGGK
jgi:hypothetical protein